MTAAISVRDLSKTFGDTQAVVDASFDVPYGSITGFIGANGSGKTTTMRMIVGLIQPTGGTALIDGVPYRELPGPRGRVGVVLDQLGAHPGLSGRRHLESIALEAGLPAVEVDRSLALVGLADAARRTVRTYSTGMKQRLSLAASLLGNPGVLILDEPASGLDPQGIRWLRELLRQRADDGAAVFVSTHQLAELATIVDHVVVIDNGRVVANEPSGALLRRSGEQRLEDAVFAVTQAVAL